MNDNNQPEIKVFVVGSQKEYAKFLNKYTLVDSLSEAELVIFTGGTDVSPHLYNEDKIVETESSNIIRDSAEISIFEECVYLGIPMLGICRGAQFLTVMNGGKLIQHVEGHNTGGHNIVDVRTKKIYQDSSGHHQMMYPYLLKSEEYNIIALASPDRSSVYKGLSCIEPDFTERNLREPEIVFYYNTGSLCIQGHPEWANPNSEYVKYCNDLIKETFGLPRKQYSFEYSEYSWWKAGC